MRLHKFLIVSVVFQVFVAMRCAEYKLEFFGLWIYIFIRMFLDL